MSNSFFGIKREEKKPSERSLSRVTKETKAKRGRVEDISPEESKVFKEVCYKVLGDEGLKQIKKMTYWFKYDMLEKNFREIIKELEKSEEGSEIVDKLLVNKRAYFTDALCTGRKFYRSLTWEQKLIVLTEMYKIYNHKTEELDTVDNKRYREAEVFIKVLDEGKIDEWYVSVSAYCDNLETLLDNKVSVSDCMFWLQNDWREMSGDYFVKKNANMLTRRTAVFGDKHYTAFNKIFKSVFGRDLRCLVNISQSNEKGILGRIWNGLENVKKPTEEETDV